MGSEEGPGRVNSFLRRLHDAEKLSDADHLAKYKKHQT